MGSFGCRISPRVQFRPVNRCGMQKQSNHTTILESLVCFRALRLCSSWQNVAVQWADLFWWGRPPQFRSDPSTAWQYSLRKVPRTTQTSSSFPSTDWYQDPVWNSCEKKSLSFAVPTPQVFHESWPRAKLKSQDITTEVEVGFFQK